MSNLIKELIDNTRMTRNQVAQISGLSNSHLRALEDEDIKNTKRDTVLYLAVALNLELPDINMLLRHYGFSDANEKDSLAFIKVAERRKVTGFQPLYSGIGFDLLLISVERLDGNLVVVNDRPSSSFRPGEYVAVEAERSGIEDDVYIHLKKEFYKKRRGILDKNLANYTVHYISCEKCIRQYMNLYNNARSLKERLLIKEHFELLIYYMDHHNYRFDLVKPDHCALLRFELKFLPSSNKENDKVLFIGQSKHRYSRDLDYGESNRSQCLNGFVTDSKKTFDLFRLEYFRLKRNIDTKYSDKNAMTGHIREMFREETGSELGSF